ncbi:hypothetical protein, partial [Streptomyces sp. NPDC086010]|uniref:hypothetical protein n=1 Tax=Streptomyces sp. NPDC086010 TaxID=3365745 RepID=UPI0037D09FA9
MPPATGQNRNRPTTGFTSLPQAIKDVVSRTAPKVVEDRLTTDEPMETISRQALSLRRYAGLKISKALDPGNGLSEQEVRERVPDLVYVLHAHDLPDELIVALLQHPHLLAAARRDDVARMLIAHPRIVENLKDAPYLVAYLKNHGISALDRFPQDWNFLERKEVIRELDMNTVLRERIFKHHPQLLSLIGERVDLLREISLRSFSFGVALSGMPGFGRALLSTTHPVREMNLIDGQAALVAAMVDVLMRGVQVRMDFPYELLFDRRFMNALRPYGRLWPVLLTVPGLLEITKRDIESGGRPSTALPLLDSDDLLQVLPYAPHFGARLMASPELLPAAVENPDVATLLSWRYEHFDDVPDRLLESALQSAALPEPRRLPLKRKEISSLRPEELFDQFVMSHPGLSSLREYHLARLKGILIGKPVLLRNIIALGDGLRGHLLDPLLSGTGLSVALVKSADTAPGEYLPALLRNLDALISTSHDNRVGRVVERFSSHIFGAYRRMPGVFEHQPHFRELLFLPHYPWWYIDTVPGLRDALIADSLLAGVAKQLASALPVLLVRRPETL